MARKQNYLVEMTALTPSDIPTTAELVVRASGSLETVEEKILAYALEEEVEIGNKILDGEGGVLSIEKTDLVQVDVELS